MTDIDVPDWVVEDACKNAWPQFRSGMETEIWEFADAARRDRLREITKAALRAALSAWIVPAGFTNSEEMRELLAGRGGWVSGIELDGDTHTLYKLRQEKPE